MKELLKSILATLETVEVKGKTNMDRMLGCMMTLEELIGKLEKVGDSDADDHAE